MVKKGFKQTDVGIIPEDWIYCSIQDLITEGILEQPLDGNHGELHPKSSDYVPFGIPFIMSNDIHNGFVDTKKCHFIRKEQAEKLRKGFAYEGDVLLTHKGTVGNVALVSEIPAEYLMLTPQVTYYRIKDKNRLFNTFIRFYFESPNFQAQLEKLSGGGTRAYIGITNQKQLPFILPSLMEQKAIAEALADVDELIVGLDKLIAKKRDVKTAVMQQLLTGKKRLPGFENGRGVKQTEIGAIPKDWDVKPLITVSTLNGRIGWQGLKQSEFNSNPDDPFLITGMNFKDGEIRWDEVYHIPEARYKIAPNIQLRSGDVLMTKDGTIGKLLYVDDIPYPGKASLNSHLLLFRPINGQYVPKFLFYQLGFKPFLDHIELNKSGSTFFGITQEAIGKYQAFLPTIPEQHAIAEVLSDIDTEITALETRRAKTQAIKQGMMQELLTGRTRLI